MREACRLACHRAQPEPLVGVEVGRLQPPVIKDERLALGVFEEQFAVVGAGDRIGNDPADGLFGDVEFF